MNNDLISRSELKKALCEFMKNNIGIYSNEMFHLVDSMPTVEERPQGEWILKETDCDDGGNNRYECSNCTYTDIHADSAEVPYCWHCGAYMRGIYNGKKETT